MKFLVISTLFLSLFVFSSCQDDAIDDQYSNDLFAQNSSFDLKSDTPRGDLTFVWVLSPEGIWECDCTLPAKNCNYFPESEPELKSGGNTEEKLYKKLPKDIRSGIESNLYTYEVLENHAGESFLVVVPAGEDPQDRDSEPYYTLTDKKKLK